jgi:hypothetical protein
MKKVIALVTSLGLIVFFAASLMSCGKPKEETAIQVVESWLALVDDEKYLESWEGLASLFKKNVMKEEWVNDLNRFRKPLGKLLDRKLVNKQQAESAPEDPVGEYLIFQYETSFENKKSIVEAVSAIKDDDGKWRILGYGIQ